MIQSPTCPSCGTALARGRSGEMCPACLLRAAMKSDAVPPFNDHPLPDLEEIRSLFPDLEIIGLIGRGGMGAVYQVRQPTLDRFAALKILPRNLAGEPGFRERFHREARTMAALNHSNIVTIHESGERDGLFFLLMEFVDGGDLGRAIRSGTLKPRETLAIIPQICEALQYAHDAGVVHRDIKPGNILLDSRGRVKVADFGIAKMVGEIHDSPFPRTYLLGTPEYMAPEQRDGNESVDHRADIYSLGAVFYELLTGKPPVEGSRESPSKCAPVDTRFDDVVQRAMAVDPELRYQNANEMRQGLERIIRPGSRTAWSVAAGLVTGAVITAIALLSHGNKTGTADPFPAVWENSLGMRFRPVPGTAVRMSIWETRLSDWQAFEKSAGAPIEVRPADEDRQGPVAVGDGSRQREFCAWLTRIERAAGRISTDDIYRLPTDREWSLAAGLQEPVDGQPGDLHLKNRGKYPWGSLAPAPSGSGNYPDSALRERMPNAVVIPNYYDGHAFTAPAGSFPANAAGFHDLGGNLWEAVTTDADDGNNLVFRGGSWLSGARGGDWDCLLSSFRAQPGTLSHLETGFRVVLAKVKAKPGPDLLTASREGDLKLVTDLLATGASLKQRDTLERSALHLAAKAGSAAVVSALIKAGASVGGLPTPDTTPLITAARQGHAESVELLLARGGNPNASSKTDGSTALILAAAGPDYVKSSPRTPGTSGPHTGTPEDFTRCVRILLEHAADPKSAMNDGTTALHTAADYNQIESLKLLLAAGLPANVMDHKLFSPLHRAAQRDSAEAAALLLDSGAKLTLPLSPNSPLHVASAAGSLKTAAILLERGADPNLRDGKSITPLHWAVSLGHPALVSLLAKHKADLAARDFAYNTPLHCAVVSGKPEIVRALLEAGADPALRNIEGATPLDYATARRLDAIVAILSPKKIP